MYQQITIIGRLGQDPEVRMTGSGQAVASLSVGVSEKWTSKDGQKQERTDWFRVTAWQKLAEICGKYLKKGSLVMFVGKMQQSSFERDGQKVYKWDLIASEMKMLGGKSDDSHAPASSQGGAASYAPPSYGGYDPAPARGGSEDDVPF
jgi:single-strand DNA-binding protein